MCGRSKRLLQSFGTSDLDPDFGVPEWVSKSLSPFFCYYGGKWRAAPRYPTPQHDTIIEPFAGAAGYATRYHDRQVILVERDPVIAELWRYLIRVSSDEIRALPDMPRDGSTTDDLPISAAARSLIGFWINKGSATPRKSPSSWMLTIGHNARPNSHWGPVIREKLASQVTAIRHWQVIEGSYEQAPEVPATWFIDPPYQVAGKHYRHGLVDYAALATWCQARSGQVMVCEQWGANWLPFKPFRTIKTNPSSRGKASSAEALWQNETRGDLFDLLRLVDNGHS